jgi:hypothetical protein
MQFILCSLSTRNITSKLPKAVRNYFPFHINKTHFWTVSYNQCCHLTKATVNLTWIPLDIKSKSKIKRTLFSQIYCDWLKVARTLVVAVVVAVVVLTYVSKSNMLLWNFHFLSLIPQSDIYWLRAEAILIPSKIQQAAPRTVFDMLQVVNRILWPCSSHRTQRSGLRRDSCSGTSSHIFDS